MKNIVLIGMPGSGKSTVAALVSAALGRPLVELDEEIIRHAGQSIPQIFQQQGEGGFRDLETAVTRSFAQKEGQVISTGGGVICRQANMTALGENGHIFFLDRSPQAIAGEAHQARPLIGTDTQRVYELYTQRIDSYRNYAQYTIPIESTPEAAAADLLKILEKVGELP